MENKEFENWLNFKTLGQPFSELNSTISDIAKRTTEQNFGIYAEAFSRYTDQLKRLSNIKRPEDYLTLMKECFNENVSAFIENSHKVTQNASQNMQELTRIMMSLRDPMTATTKMMEKARGRTEREHEK